MVLCTTHKVCCSLLKDLSVSNMRETQQVKKIFYTHFCKTSLFNPKSQHYFPTKILHFIYPVHPYVFKKKNYITYPTSQQKHFMHNRAAHTLWMPHVLVLQHYPWIQNHHHCPRWRTHRSPNIRTSKWPMALLMCQTSMFFILKYPKTLCQSNNTVYCMYI